jgi:branched-chain amino acid transport system permease protein
VPPVSIEFLLQQCLIGLTNGALIALVALGYTMVYGIIRLINFAHGDLIMLGSCCALSLVGWLGLTAADQGLNAAGQAGAWAGIALLVVLCGLFCGGLNLAVDRLVYKPLRTAPKLAPLVSAIGVSFIFMNIGLFWLGPADRSFPELLPATNLLAADGLQFSAKDLLVLVVVVPLMLALSFLVRATRLGKAMRAVSQDPTAAALVGIDVDRVIAATFFVGGFLGGAASVIYGLYINTISFQMGFQNGLYAFTAAVLGGIGSIPGAVVGGVVIGLVRALSSAYVGERWTGAIVFAILIVILVFRPEGLLGRGTKEKV